MAFPEDYRRVQMAGGIEADVATQVGLPRQVLAEMTNLNLRLMDGVKQGGHVVQMEKDLDKNVQAIPNLEGEVEYVETGTDTPGQADQRKRLWKASKLRSLMLKIADITLQDSAYVWSIKNSVLPSRIRTNATLVADPNTATMTGWYRIAPGSANMPNDAPSAGTVNLMLEVVSQSESDLVQILYVRDGTGKIWLRSRADGVWGAWVLSTGLTSLDLDTRVKKAGDTMTGKLFLTDSSAARASLRLISGADPAAPDDGDIWRTAVNGIRFRKGGVTRTILDSENGVQFVKDNGGAFGVGQAIAANPTYFTAIQNTTDKTIMVGNFARASLGQVCDIGIRFGPTNGVALTACYQYIDSDRSANLFALIPPGWFFYLHIGGSAQQNGSFRIG